MACILHIEIASPCVFLCAYAHARIHTHTHTHTFSQELKEQANKLKEAGNESFKSGGIGTMNSCNTETFFVLAIF